jgi:hypothetical protein
MFGLNGLGWIQRAKSAMASFFHLLSLWGFTKVQNRYSAASIPPMLALSSNNRDDIQKILRFHVSAAMQAGYSSACVLFEWVLSISQPLVLGCVEPSYDYAAKSKKAQLQRKLTLVKP